MTELFTAMIVVFVAELGDKTQLVALGFGARHRTRTVLAGVTLAYVASITLSVLVGGLLGGALPSELIGVGGGVLFIGFALWTLWAERHLVLGHTVTATEADLMTDEQHSANDTGSGRLVLSIATMMFIAELGDKTMLAAATLAANGNPIPVWIGATIGIIGAGFAGVFAGRVVGDRLPERAIAIGSSMLFALFGVALIALNL